MPENRYFIDQKFTENGHLKLPKEEQRHLKVMRITLGDNIELVNGQNQLATATLITPDTAQITTLRSEPPPTRQIILAQALLKPKNLDLVIEKGTELGATAFWLFPGDKSEKKGLSETQITRLKNLTISALKQCGRLDLPPIELKPPLSKWTKPPHQLYFGDLSSNTPLQTTSSAIIVIGPESGFSSDELKHLQTLKAQGINLGPYILRAETAALCALSKISF